MCTLMTETHIQTYTKYALIVTVRGTKGAQSPSKLNMRKYRVALSQTVYWDIEVEAEDEGSAEEKAKEEMPSLDESTNFGKLRVDILEEIE